MAAMQESRSVVVVSLTMLSGLESVHGTIVAEQLRQDRVPLYQSLSESCSLPDTNDTFPCRGRLRNLTC